ncbi:hypothetical protein SSYRP_v1c06370 [Spiroplasma syrphidicola EA-1]|uniref:Transmembrane protein n=1 Tax=Spiroplasma syrphidicola EA-1 TaxID=1276229 RepID=R4U456_9MOLU|nr:hypothetical protein [Spiroplasma syrphidicola]AGM26227.1 hypothetical protein SSYRP_v1c06370 [Spiroplasma syrphidicola EA-1]
MKQELHFLTRHSAKIKYGLFVIFALVPLFCVLLDLFFSTIIMDSQYGEQTRNFDYSIINQSIYLSVWIALATSCYGFLNWINCHTKTMPTWITGKNNLTRIVTLNLISFLIFTLTFAIAPQSIVGFNTWYKIIKSVFEHMLIPIIILAYYFLFTTNKISTKQYCQKYCWYNLPLLIIYVTYVFLRWVMLVTYFPSDKGEPFTPMPYDQIDPANVGYPLFFLAIFALLLVTISLAILLNFLSNLRSKKGKQI